MGKITGIQWTDHTFNPWWGCQKVSEGCTHCYAERLSTRFHKKEGLWSGNRRLLKDTTWSQPLRWNETAKRNGRRAKVFCGSMCDIFEDNPILEEERQRVYRLIQETPWLDWLLLTKRPENIEKYPPLQTDNLWLLTTCENQKRFDERVPILLKQPARVKGLSLEPLLGPIDMSAYIREIDWIIVGGETGSNRKMKKEWVDSLYAQCKEHNVPFFFKQWGNGYPDDEPVLYPQQFPLWSYRKAQQREG